MDNIILAGMLRDFAERFDLFDDKHSVQFEKFLNYCLLNEDYYDSFDFDKVSTDQCMGIDGLAIIIDGVIVYDVENARSLTQGQFDSKFVFIQSKTSTKFNFGDFLKFISTIKVFFGDEKSSLPNELNISYDIKELIYSRASKFRDLPVLDISYGYAGNLQLEETGLIGQIESEVQNIKNIPYRFSRVKWAIHDGNKIESLYRESQNEIQHKVSFQRHIAIPTINGVKSTYLGVMKCNDFIQLISKQDGDINKGLFVGNVRDFLGGQNPVNSEIEKTLNSGEEKDRFAILNNGVTIVAKKVIPSGDIFELSKFQIVNGCQTSHVLFNNKALVTDNMYLTVKLIETSDMDIGGSIIATTNSQSQVTKEAFATIRPYHRRIEDFFKALRDAGYIYYYERRPHQFDDIPGIMQKNIATAPSLIKSFISVVLEEPHKVHYYYGQLLTEYNRKESSELFSDADHPGLYFLSHHITSMTKEKVLHDQYLKNWLFHISLLIKKILLPSLTKNKTITDRKFLDMLNNIDTNFESSFRRASDVISELGLPINSNRILGTTSLIVDKIFGKHTTLIQEHQTKVVGLLDGTYQGIIKCLIKKDSSCLVKYGPFEVSVAVDSVNIETLSEGNSIDFNLENGIAHI